MEGSQERKKEWKRKTKQRPTGERGKSENGGEREREREREREQYDYNDNVQKWK